VNELKIDKGSGLERPGAIAERSVLDQTRTAAATVVKTRWFSLLFAILSGGCSLAILTQGPLFNIAASSLIVLSIASFCVFSWQLGRDSNNKNARRKLISLVKDADYPAFLTNNRKKIVTVNENFRRSFETIEGQSLVNMTALEGIADHLKSQSKPEFLRLCASAEQGCRDVGEVLLIGERGIPRYWRLSVQPVVAMSPTLSSMTFWQVDDLTQQREVDIERGMEEMFLADLLDQLPVGFFSSDADGDMRYVNNTLANWLGLDQDEIGKSRNGGQTSFAEFVALDAGLSDGDEAAVEEDASGMHGGLILRARDGYEFPAYLIQSQRETGAGDFDYSRSVVLRTPFMPLADDGMGGPILKRLPWLFADAPVGIVLLDLQGEVLDCNRSFLKLLGLHRDGVIGRPLSERINKEDRSDADAQLSKVVMGIMPATLLDVRMPAGGERELTASLYVSRITDSEEDVAGLVLHVIDTTEQKNLEIQFNQAQKMQAVGQLAGGVAHDFNNLLTAMIGFCDLLLGRHGPEDPSFADIMQIKQNANRAANLVRQLLAFSRRQTLQPKVFAITDALNDLSNLLRRLIGENISLDMTHGEDVDLIRTDPGQFDQVIINLAVNARDAMPGGGMITVSTERVTVENSIQRGHEVMPAGVYILIKVGDTGSGIAKEDISRIFEPFFSTKGVGEGTGLGLSTVYGIVRQSEGFVFVDSALGEGTLFSLYLPAFSAAEAAAGELMLAHGMEAQEEIDLTGSSTVLLVEDEDAVRVFGSRALRNKGYRVLEASDGEQALDVINEFDEDIDLIITDVVMPGMDGHTLVRLVLEEIPEIKVILMSGYAEEAIPGEIGEDQTINFLPKPFTLQELAGKVKEVIAT